MLILEKFGIYKLKKRRIKKERENYMTEERKEESQKIKRPYRRKRTSIRKNEKNVSKENSSLNKNEIKKSEEKKMQSTRRNYNKQKFEFKKSNLKIIPE